MIVRAGQRARFYELPILDRQQAMCYKRSQADLNEAASAAADRAFVHASR
jgi:hypothetical protein